MLEDNQNNSSQSDSYVNINKEFSIALVGNPNSGKSTLFNSLTGLNVSTANFSGTTVEFKKAKLKNEKKINIIDLPGLYTARTPSSEEKVTCEVLEGKSKTLKKPNALIFVADASRLERSLTLYREVNTSFDRIIVVLTMSDIAVKQGYEVDTEKLAKELNCEVVKADYKKLDNISHLVSKIKAVLDESSAREVVSTCTKCSLCPFQDSYNWSEQISLVAIKQLNVRKSNFSRSLDAVLTHSILGTISFLFIMTLFFITIFYLASYPMDLLDQGFSYLAGVATDLIPNTMFASLVSDGVISGVGSLMVFIPQVALLFFLLSILQDTGYLSRVALILERFFKRIGLPGIAFIPLLSAHACAIPAIMSSRIIENKRDRLATILIIPLMSCSARLPVYVMIASLLFSDSAIKSGLVFMVAYILGISFALLMSWVLKKTILRGEASPLAIELPEYRLPNLKNALIEAYTRSWQFIKQAGSIILFISVIMWVLMTFPQNENLQGADHVKQSYAGQLGTFIEPVIEPLGFDWRIGIGIISSFAAREVIVSTLGIVAGIDDVDNTNSLYDSMRAMTRVDGTPLFTFATCLSLLIFYVLAMQCLPTQVVTKKETGKWSWAIFQFVYMSILAYVMAFITYQVCNSLLL